MEQDLKLAMPGGTADAVLFSPKDALPLPGVLHIPDIASIRESHRAMARRLAAAGYTVLLVNPFYRTSAPPVFDFPRKMGEPRTMQRFAELTGPLTPEAQTADVAAYLEFLTSQPAVRPGPIGVVGFCFGGAMALRAAAAAPDKVAAAASFHGGNLYKPDDPASPHLLLPRVSARLYFGHATADPTMSADAILHFEAALADWGGSFASETYDGASHGWTVPDNPVFNPTQADRAFAKLTQLFQEALH